MCLKQKEMLLILVINCLIATASGTSGNRLLRKDYTGQVAAWKVREDLRKRLVKHLAKSGTDKHGTSLNLVWFYYNTTVWCVIKLKSFRWVMVINPIRLRGCWNVVRWRLSHDDFVDLRILFLSERQADVCQTQVCRTRTGRMYTPLPRSGLLSDSLWLWYEIIHYQLQITVHKWYTNENDDKIGAGWQPKQFSEKFFFAVRHMTNVVTVWLPHEAHIGL